ncbi:MAG TPA: translocation/assembly module TamB domain-containing protein [Verrucomicrobiae bacterium]
MLRPLARHWGVTYSRYERHGYAHFSLYNLNYARGNSRLTAERFGAPVPTVWLWRSRSGTSRSSGPFMQVDGWQYQTVGGTNKAAGVQKPRNYARALQELGKWLPQAALSNGTLRVRALPIRVPGALWSHGSIAGVLQCGLDGPQLTFTARPAGVGAYEARLDSESVHLTSRARISTTTSGLLLQSTNFWWSNRVELQARFVPGRSLPETAHLAAPRVRLPPEALGILHYGEVAGSVSADWQDGKFRMELEAQARPLRVATNFPPLVLSLHARGDTNSALIEDATLVSPWLTAELSRGLEVHFTGKRLRQPAFLRVAANLERQPWFPARGKLNGEAQFTPSWGAIPAVDFHLAGEQLTYRSVQTHSLELTGSLAWPGVELSDAEVTLDDGSILQGRGKVDFQEKTVSDGHLRIAGPWLRRWLPKGYDLQSMEVSGNVSGPFAALNHQGRLGATNVTVPHLRPMDLTANWKGVGPRLSAAEVLARAGHSSLQLEGAVEGGSTGARAQLFGISLRTNGEPVLSLVHPAEVQISFPGLSPVSQVRSSVLAFEGKAGRIELETAFAWPRQGAFAVHLERVCCALANDFLNTNLPPISINRMDATGDWTNGPIRFVLSLDAEIPPVSRTGIPGPLHVSLDAMGDPVGLTISNLVATSEAAPVLVAQGSLPLTFSPADVTDVVQMRPGEPLRLRATAAPEAFFWEDVAEATGLRLFEPHLSADLSGSWRAPVGKLVLRAAEIKFQRTTNAVPDLKDLHLEIELGLDQARLQMGEVLVQGQRATFSGDLPLGPGFWNGWRLPDWTKATARLQIPRAELAAFEPLFPQLLAPQGDLSADLRLSPGGKIEGRVSLDQARTRPLGNMGPIRDIGLRLELHEHELTLEDASARIGGATLTMNGQSDLAGTNWLSGEWPPFSLSIRGTGIPLARTPEFVLRSDLALSVTRTNGAPPLVSGVVTLRDSFYLADLQNLIPGKVTAPSRRPPYFSIQEERLSDWRLRVDVKGAKFLKVRSPLFNGEISASLKLQGTPKDPIALGDLKIDSGLVRFPFASIPVQQGVVSLSSQDPYHPQLSVSGASKQFGYDIRMEITGPANAPLIQFNSTPPLSSEQILLMVTAGELPPGAFSLSAQQRAQTMAVFLGRDVLAQLGLGDQVEQRLSLHTGAEVSEQGRPTYNVEYRLTNRWSVTGEYDRFGDYNAGFKWRIFSK